MNKPTKYALLLWAVPSLLIVFAYFVRTTTDPNDYIFLIVFLAGFALFSFFEWYRLKNREERSKEKITEEAIKKIQEEILAYKNEFIKKEISPIQFMGESYSSLTKIPNTVEIAQHCYWMLIQMEQQIKDGKFEINQLKEELGFVKGCMFSITATVQKDSDSGH